MNYKHGMHKQRICQIWYGINKRCNSIKSKGYHRYGGRGIKNMFMSYDDFYSWSMDNGYDDTLSIDRIDNDGNYEPSNCRWISSSENSRRSSTRYNYCGNNSIKISIDVASEICEMYNTGIFTQKEIGNGLSVSYQTIGKIVRESRM